MRRFLGVLAAVCMLVALAGGPARAADLGDRLVSGGAMATTDQLTSAGGAFRFVLQDDGNAVVYSGAMVPHYATGTRGGTRFVLQDDGNAVLYSLDNVPLWNSGTAGRPAAYLVMQDDGNLVLVGAGGAPTWSSRTGVLGAPAPVPTGPELIGTTLGSGARLSAGQGLAVGGWLALVQGDGNVVVYANGRPQFSTATGGNPGASLLMQADGNLVVYSVSNRPLWNSRTGASAGARLVLQDDGNLVIYRADGTAAWSRTTGLVNPPAPPPPPNGVYYANCDEVRAAGAAPLYRGQPGYRSGLDRDGDGIACEV